MTAPIDRAYSAARLSDGYGDAYDARLAQAGAEVRVPVMDAEAWLDDTTARGEPPAIRWRWVLLFAAALGAMVWGAVAALA